MIYLLRKPFKGSLAENALAHKCGGLNIDATRVSTQDNLKGGAHAACVTERHDKKKNWRYTIGGAGEYRQPTGRWPANFIRTTELELEADWLRYFQGFGK